MPDEQILSILKEPPLIDNRRNEHMFFETALDWLERNVITK